MRRPAALVLGATLVLARAEAQAPTLPPARAELVELDVIVTDPRGVPVTDLVAADFEVLEDGKAQALDHFTRVDRTPAPAPDPAAEVLVVPRAAPSAAVVPPRHVVVVVDDLHVAPAGMERLKAALRSFVDGATAAGDRVALVTTAAPPVIEQLTGDRAVLGAAISRLTARQVTVAAPRNSQMTPAQAEMILAGDRSALSLAARTLMLEPGSVLDSSSPQVAVGAPAGSAVGPSTDAEAKERLAETMAQRQARGVLDEALRFSGATLVAVADVLKSLAPLPGRKICLLASDGFLVGRGTSEERSREMRMIVDAATRSGAAVYALDTRGLVTTGGDASVLGGNSPGLQTRVDRQGEQLQLGSLERLARETGGFVVRNSNDLGAGLQRMLADSNAYYLMAYAPVNARRDGRFRRIEVRLPRRRDLTVRTRSGYFEAKAGEAAPAPRASGPADDGEMARLLATVGTASAPDALPVTLAADFLDLPPLGAQALLRAHVDLRAVTWREAGGKHLADVEVLGAIYDAEGRAVTPTFGRVTSLALSDDEWTRARRDGFGFRHAVALPPGRYQVRLVARERVVGPAGSAVSAVEVPDLHGGRLAASGLFLSASREADGPLRDAQVARRFRAQETLVFQLYVYNAAAPADVVLQAQIWKDGQAIAASRPQAAALAQKDGIPVPESHSLPLAGLATGRYELRVVVVDRRARTEVRRQLEFTIE